MAHMWMTDEGGHWQSTELTGDTFPIGGGHGDGDVSSSSLADVSFSRLHRLPGEHPSWAVIHSPEFPLWVNGDRLPAGIRVLADRDELLFRSATDASLVRVYYSTEVLADLQHFPGGMKSTICPRCKQRLEEGDPAVRCPACGMWHHQREDRQCWTYAEHCGMCDCGTDLDQGYRWTPEEL